MVILWELPVAYIVFLKVEVLKQIESERQQI